jgi:mono/diheme cytochrome c family protein
LFSVAGACTEVERPSARLDERLRAIAKERADELDPRAAGIGRLVPDLEFVDLAGSPGRLSDCAGRPLVLAIRDVGCPLSKKTAPALARLEREFAPRGVEFLFVDESENDSAEELAADAATHGFRGRHLLDPAQAFGRALGATTTTEVFLLDSARTLVYRGAIDDQYGRGTALPAPRREFLRDALERTLARAPVALPATTAPGCLLGIEAAASESPAGVSYHREVARILQQNCVECHRTGGAGPFPLESYADARGKRAMIRLVVAERLMPPWFAAEGTGPWENDRRLSDEERATLLSWIEAGAPEGDAADSPVPLVHPQGWTIGQPDLVFQLDREYEIPAEGALDFRYIAADREVPEDLWISAMQVLPSDPEVVHHVTVSVQPPRSGAARARSELRTALLPWSTRPSDGWQFLFPYLPGNGPRVHADGTARFVPRGSQLRFDMHYTPRGVATRDRTRLGLVLAGEPPAYLSESRNVRQYELAIPPGAADVSFAQEFEFRHAVALQSLTPHMHLRGQAFEVELVEPDGARRLLLRLATWDPNWQFTYSFRDPPLVPTGARLAIRAWYDNSAANANNPDPSVWVHDGPQVWDEMLSLVIEWVRPRALE